MRIYTPNVNTGKVEAINAKGNVSIKIKRLDGSEYVYNCIACGLRRNSWNDNDLRVELKPSDKNWFGRMIVSEQTNDHGQIHVSQIEILK